MPDIFEVIKGDHDKHRDLLARIEDTPDGSKDRNIAWQNFYYDVKSHAAAEEETFYSKLMSQPWGQDAARHSVHEHQQMDDLLEKLNDMDMAAPEWLETFRKLRHDYEHHIDEEETEIFARAREVVDKAEWDRHGADFETRKSREREIVDQKSEDALED
ncbi:hemerythrin domain-containing protein [Anianabacter salinae]|uniref:hemerythrin domain-containing protein n=1 Tax=Anianabacter salinae TaxID=2851023 RepID=UPI00225E6917|nr:hemerythrin domain-containing protein [Anianabacter salinae]MBV0912627.1 hemerythrin domain-containing protein [Anianabacter salinae]